MSICPKCHDIIEYVNWNETQHKFGTYSLEEGYEEDSNCELGNDSIVFSCPSCDEELDFSESDVDKFLEEKDELKEMLQEKVNEVKNA